MVTVIKKGDKQKDIDKALKKIFSEESAGINAWDFCGKVDFKEDALKIQKRMRDEWQ